MIKISIYRDLNSSTRLLLIMLSSTIMVVLLGRKWMDFGIESEAAGERAELVTLKWKCFNQNILSLPLPTLQLN